RRPADGTYRWHLTRAIPMRDRSGAVVKWFGSNIDIHDQKRAEEAQRFLVEAGAVLTASLNYRSTLAAVAKLAVPRIADWARVDMVEDGRLRTLAVEHVDPKKVELAFELARRYPENPDAEQGPPLVLRTGTSELAVEISEERLAELAQDDFHLGPGRERGATRPGPLPFERDGHERWASISGVEFDEGVVYAFQDISADRALEQIRQDLVATVSHELRTPLAAIYGSAITLNRDDLEL